VRVPQASAAEPAKSISYGFSSTGNVSGDFNAVATSGTFDADVAQDYFAKYGEALPDTTILRLFGYADYAEGVGGRRTTDVRADNLVLLRGGDGVGDACDNCVAYYNPGQGPAVFGRDVVPPASDTFSWVTSDDVKYVRGDLAGVGAYSTSVVQDVPAATSFTDGGTPGAGHGFYYLLRLDGECTVASWQTRPGAEPDRDTALP
jgi:hypothetical protein